MSRRNKHIIISGGGTGGHIFPAIAIAKELRNRLPEARILFIGAKGRMEMEKVPEAGFEIKGLWISGLRRDLSPGNLIFPLKLISSLIKSWSIQRSFKPDVVIGVGGFASGPALRVAGWRGTPTLIQEQNSFPGITNRLLANRACRICVAYPGMERYFPAEKIVVTGNPIRSEVIDIQGKRQQGAERFGMDPDRQTLLIVGGSQGALAINEAILAHLGYFKSTGLQVVWQTGPVFHPKAEEMLKAMDCPQIKAFSFIKEMDLAYALSDVVISRAGAIASAELAAAGKPVIFVPLPTAAEDHQTRNARAFADKDAAILLPNDHIKDELPRVLDALLKDAGRLEKLAAHIREFARPDATARICDEIISLIDRQ